MTGPATLAAALMEELNASHRTLTMLRLEHPDHFAQRRRLEAYRAALDAALWAVRDYHDLNASWRRPGPAYHPPQPEEQPARVVNAALDAMEQGPLPGCRVCGARHALPSGLCPECADMERCRCPVCGAVETDAGLCSRCDPAVARMAAG